MNSDQEAKFVDFVLNGSPQLLTSAWFICGDALQAEELVQNALEKVYLAWRRIEPGRELAYARRTMVHSHIDTRRHRAREVLTDRVPDVGGSGPTEDTVLLVRALQDLTVRERQIVVLRYYADLPEAEVADLLGVSVGTVKSTASRGLAHLRDRLALEGESHVT